MNEEYERMVVIDDALQSFRTGFILVAFGAAVGFALCLLVFA